MKEGSEIKGYAIRERLGKGGMGEVWAAVAPDGRDAVIKCLPSDVTEPEEARELKSRLRREAQILVGLEHEGIVDALDWFESDGEIYLVLERIQGPTLAEWLSSAPPLTTRVELMRQVVAAVAWAHAQQIIHRDLKPGNILVAEGPRAKVLDFGLARAVDSTRLTQTGVTLGTIAYMAPEQARALSVDARADVFSLGMILAQALDLAEPFRDAADSARMYRTLVSNDPVAIDGWVPADVASVLSSLLEKDRTRRGSIEDLVTLLERLAAEGESLARRLADARSAFEASGAPPALPPIDRPELARVLDQLGARRASGKGGVVLVLGPPGCGKTWVLMDAAERLRSAGVRTFESVFVETAAPFRIPWEYILERARLESQDGASTGETVSLPRDPAAAASLVQRFLDDVCRDAAGGLALLLDDVHLASENDHGWIDRLAELARDYPVSLLLSGDSASEGAGEERSAVYGAFLSRAAASSEVTAMKLGALPEDQVVAGLDLHGVAATEARGIYGTSDGNPELINLLLAHRHAGGNVSDLSGLGAPHLERLRGRYQLVDPICRRTIRALLEAGGEATVAKLATAAGSTELAIHPHLQDLERKHGWVKRSGTTVRITHPLLGRTLTD